MSYYGAHNSSKRIKEQINWDDNVKDSLWCLITKQKILNQSAFLYKHDLPEYGKMLLDFANQVESNDVTNREGHAAKVYFNHGFFEGFTREKDCYLNNCLNYGYMVLLAQFNRAIVSAGYLTQLGIHHKNEYNDFNLSCDFIEPFRFLVDEKAMTLKEGDDFKKAMIDLLQEDVDQLGKKQSLNNAIDIYCASLFNALNTGDLTKIAFLDYGIRG